MRTSVKIIEEDGEYICHLNDKFSMPCRDYKVEHVSNGCSRIVLVVEAVDADITIQNKCLCRKYQCD